VSEIQMAAGQLLADLHSLLQWRVQVVASLSGALIQVDVERQLVCVAAVSDEAGDANSIHFMLDLSQTHGLTLLANFCGFHDDPIRALTEAVRILGPRYEPVWLLI
jgi:hypothetical protein